MSNNVKLETITPEKAKHYITTMLRNRTVRPKHVNSLARDIGNDHWKVNGETIKFNSVGELIDGQHRLLAVIKAGKAIETYVVTNIPENTMDTIDVGRQRDPGDIFGIEGYENARNLAAALRWLWRYDTHQMIWYEENPTIETLKEEIDKHPKIRESLSFGTLTARYITKSLGSALHCLFAEKNLRTADILFYSLKEGSNLMRGDPVYTLRQRLIKNITSKAKLPPFEVAALTIKAFNGSRTNTRVLTLRWSNKGDNTEEFPVII